MLFELKVNLTDEDYFEFNKFWTVRSHYGRSQMVTLRIFCAVVVLICSTLQLFSGDDLTHKISAIIAAVIGLILIQALFNKIFLMFLKWHIKGLKKKGKMGYSPESTMQFGESMMTEITPVARTEQAYSALERISIVGDVIYLHVNNVGAYILPASAFESTESRSAFIEFIKTKCQNVDLY